MNTLRTTILMAGLFALFMAIGQVVGGQSGMFLGFGLALVMNLGTYWFSDKLAIASSGAQPVSEEQVPQLYQSIRKLSQNANIPMPKVYVIPSMQPNAFATGRNPNHSAVAVTQGLIRMLNNDELEGVIAHELAHIKHRDILISSIAATMGSAISMLANFAMFFGGRDENGRPTNPLILILTMLLAPISAMLIQMAISRSREFEADRGGAQISGKPLALASALQRIESAAQQVPMNVSPASSHMYIINPLSALGGLRNLFRTHPQTTERIQKLRELASAR